MDIVLENAIDMEIMDIARGTRFEKTLTVTDDLARGESRDLIFANEDQYEKEKSDNSLAHAWAMAADVVNYEQVKENLSKMKSSNPNQILEVIDLEIARMVIPHLDDKKFMRAFLEQAIKLWENKPSSLASQG